MRTESFSQALVVNLEPCPPYAAHYLVFVVYGPGCARSGSLLHQPEALDAPVRSKNRLVCELQVLQISANQYEIVKMKRKPAYVIFL